MARERSELEQRRAEPRRSLGVGARRAVRRARQSVIVLPSTRRPALAPKKKATEPAKMTPAIRARPGSAVTTTTTPTAAAA